MEVMNGYVDTEIGSIPSDWTLAELGNICDFENGDRGVNYPSPGSFVFSGVPFINAGHVSKGFIDTSSMNYITKESYERLGGGKVKEGDILFCLRGSLGKFGVVPSCFGLGAIASSMIIIRPKKSAVLLGYLMVYFDSSLCAQMIERWAGGAAQPNLGGQDLAKFLLPVPRSEIEQHAIATALSDVDALIAGLEKLIAKKRNLKQAAMQQLLTGQTRLPGFSGEWTVKRLGDHFTILKNGVNSRAELSVEGGVAYLHYGDIHGSKSLFLNPQNTTMPTLPLAKAKDLDRLQSGDLVFADASEDLDGVGKSVEVQGSDVLDLVSGQHTIAIRFDKTVLADGFKAYLQFFPAFRAHLNRLAAGTKVYATNRSHMASAEIKLPEVDEQIAIASILHSMDADLSVLEFRLAKTGELKQGMMQELLTGRTRLI